MTIESMVERFQCPGCVNGMDITCGKYKLCKDKLKCTGHCLGTSMAVGGMLLSVYALGLPKGFCRPGHENGGQFRIDMDIRLWPKGTKPNWNNMNVPVWAMEREGFLFVRTFAPRINMTWVDVVEEGSMSMVPNAIDVSEFIDDID